MEETSALDLIESTVANLPAPVKVSFFRALGHLLGGLTAIPATKLKQYAQSIEDVTNARSHTTAIIAQAVAQDARADPMLMQAATEIYLPTTLRKARNRLIVAEKAAEHISQSASGEAQSASPSDDWMNSFMRFSEDASSDQLQDLFGRILAGQVLRPGSFALATLRAVSELDREIANDFSKVWEKSVGDAVDYGPEFQRGEYFGRWRRLVDAGLMAPAQTARFLPPFSAGINGNGLWTPMSAGQTYLLIQFTEQSTAQWTHIDFTRAGREVGSILARPDFEANMRQVGQKLARLNLARVELHSAGKPVELIAAQ